jgi:hypothetical protein
VLKCLTFRVRRAVPPLQRIVAPRVKLQLTARGVVDDVWCTVGAVPSDIPSDLWCSTCQRGHWRTHKPVCKALSSILSEDVKDASFLGSQPSEMGAVVAKPAPKSVDAFIARLHAHRARYGGLGKPGWWWLFEDTLDDVAQCLREHHMVWLDDFLLPHQAVELREEVTRAKEAGMLQHGVLGGGRLGSSLGYVHEKVRGDLMAWFNGDEPERCWVALPQYGKKACDFLQSVLEMYVVCSL